MNGKGLSGKFLSPPQEPTWWIWLVEACLLATGLSGHPLGFALAISLAATQAVYFFLRDRSMRSSAAQIRVAYTAVLTICFVPALRWLYWLPTLGTFALVIFGYCLMTRFLSLMPWNRREKISADLLRRTFFASVGMGCQP